MPPAKRFRLIAGPNGSRAYFFDNSEDQMKYLASWSEGEGFDFQCEPGERPGWFLSCQARN